MKIKFLVSYDITKDKNRKKISDILEEFGERWQYSVFCCYFTLAEKEETIKRITKLLGKNDSVIFIPISDNLIKKSDFIGTISNFIKENPDIRTF